MPRQIVIVAPDFPPCNRAGVHRARLFANHLTKFGYHPIVLSVDPAYYEGKLDRELERTVSSDVEIVRTGALPIRPVRLVGDMGIRSFWHHYRRLCALARERKIDLIYIPIQPNYSALLGPLMHRKFGIPYVIDYMDPWIYALTEEEKKSIKPRVTNWLSHKLEPLALSRVAGLTTVAMGYLDGVFARHPKLKALPVLAVPMGREPLDDELVDKSARPSETLPQNGKKVLVYAGAILPHALDTFRALFEAAKKTNEPVHFLFLGTGGNRLARMAAEYGIAESVTEIAERQSYLEVLTTLRRAHGVLIIGSNEAHYTASKTFQALGSGRPILALLHEKSTAAQILDKAEGTHVVRFNDSALAKVEEISRALPEILRRPAKENFSREVLKEFSAEKLTEQLAKFFDGILTP